MSSRRSRMYDSSCVALASEIAIRFCRTDFSSDLAEMINVSAVSTPHGISEMARNMSSRWVLIRERDQDGTGIRNHVMTDRPYAVGSLGCGDSSA